MRDHNGKAWRLQICHSVDKRDSIRFKNNGGYHIRIWLHNAAFDGKAARSIAETRYAIILKKWEVKLATRCMESYHDCGTSAICIGLWRDGARKLDGEYRVLHFTGVIFWHSSSNWGNTDSVTAMGITGPLYTKSPATLWRSLVVLNLVDTGLPCMNTAKGQNATSRSHQFTAI